MLYPPHRLSAGRGAGQDDKPGIPISSAKTHANPENENGSPLQLPEATWHNLNQTYKHKNPSHNH